MEATQEIFTAKITSANPTVDSNEETKDATPVNYEWPPTPTPNPIYFCTIA